MRRSQILFSRECDVMCFHQYPCRKAGWAGQKLMEMSSTGLKHSVVKDQKTQTFNNLNANVYSAAFSRFLDSVSLAIMYWAGSEDQSSRVYLWEQTATVDELESLKRELSSQEDEIDENLRQSEASHQQLQAMICDLRKDLDSCRAQTWSLEQCSELDGYKAILLSRMEPIACSVHGEISDNEVAELDELNETADAELASLMEKLSSVRNEMQELDEKRRMLAKELEEFEESELMDGDNEGEDLRALRVGNLLQRA